MKGFNADQTNDIKYHWLFAYVPCLECPFIPYVRLWSLHNLQWYLKVQLERFKTRILLYAFVTLRAPVTVDKYSSSELICISQHTHALSHRFPSLVVYRGGFDCPMQFLVLC